jgi:hypothetical protein
LTQFQAKRATREGTLDLLRTLNRALSEQALPEETLETIFAKFWPDLETSLLALPGGVTPLARPRAAEDILAEVLNTVRDLARQMAAMGRVREHVGAPSSLTATNAPPEPGGKFKVGSRLGEVDISGLWETPVTAKEKRKYSAYSSEELKRRIASVQSDLDHMDDSTGHLAGPLQLERAELEEELDRRRARGGG